MHNGCFQIYVFIFKQINLIETHYILAYTLRSKFGFTTHISSQSKTKNYHGFEVFPGIRPLHNKEIKLCLGLSIEKPHTLFPRIIM